MLCFYINLYLDASLVFFLVMFVYLPCISLFLRKSKCKNNHQSIIEDILEDADGVFT